MLSSSRSTGLSIVWLGLGFSPAPLGRKQKRPAASACAAVSSAANAVSPTVPRYSAWTTRPASKATTPPPCGSARMSRPFLPPMAIACVSSARSMTSSEPWNVPLGIASRLIGAGGAGAAGGAAAFFDHGAAAAAAVAVT
jgi:hypothetical protein